MGRTVQDWAGPRLIVFSGNEGRGVQEAEICGYKTFH